MTNNALRHFVPTYQLFINRHFCTFFEQIGITLFLEWATNFLVLSIRFKNKETKREIAKLAGNQTWIDDAPVFLVFVMDFYKTDLGRGRRKVILAEQRVLNSAASKWNHSCYSFSILRQGISLWVEFPEESKFFTIFQIRETKRNLNRNMYPNLELEKT